MVELKTDTLLSLAKNCIEYDRAERRKDTRSILRNHNQIVHQCSAIVGTPLKEIIEYEHSTDKQKKEDVKDILKIINANVTDGSAHTNIRELIEISDEESVWYCDDCNLMIFVDAPNDWAHSRRAEDGWEAHRNHDESDVEGCND